jgi:NAD(P)-dependent dehydrogenase (short-subunit alcohol dehydrogenase family)
MKDLQDRVVVVTGGGSGIGQLMSIEFCKRGSVVVVLDVNQAGMDQTRERCLAAVADARVHCFRVDLCNREAIYRTMGTNTHFSYVRPLRARYPSHCVNHCAP